MSFSGPVPTHKINCLVKLTFGKETKEPYVVKVDGNFEVVEIPKSISKTHQDVLFDITPSVLGTDILLGHFKLCLDKKTVELTPLK